LSKSRAIERCELISCQGVLMELIAITVRWMTMMVPKELLPK